MQGLGLSDKETLALMRDAKKEENNEKHHKFKCEWKFVEHLKIS